MARLATVGFETGTPPDPTAQNEIVSTGTTVSTWVTSPAPFTGTYCGRCQATTTSDSSFNPVAIAANGTGAIWAVDDTFTQFRFQYATKPASSSEQFFNITDGAGTVKMSGRINSTGNLSLWNTLGIQLGSDGATVLAANTWYGIRVRCGTGALANYELQIKAGSAAFASELSGTGNLNVVQNGSFFLGKRVNVNGQTVDFFYDDFIIDDTAYPDANEIVKAMTPDANGTTMQWTGGTGASDYTQVDEIPPDDTDYVQSVATGTQPYIALFNFISSATAGINGTIKTVKAMTRSRENATSTSADLITISSGGTRSDSTTLNGTTTVQMKQRLLELDPNTSAAWTISALDAVQAGAVENNNVAYRCSSVLIMVSYVPAVGPANVKTINGLAKASVKTVNGLAIASVKTWDGLN